MLLGVSLDCNLAYMKLGFKRYSFPLSFWFSKGTQVYTEKSPSWPVPSQPDLFPGDGRTTGSHVHDCWHSFPSRKGSALVSERPSLLSSNPLRKGSHTASLPGQRYNSWAGFLLSSLGSSQAPVHMAWSTSSWSPGNELHKGVSQGFIGKTFNPT